MPSRPRRRTTKTGPDDVLPSDKLAAFGQNLREARLKQGMLQRELAKLADVDTPYLGKIEDGKVNLTFKLMERIAQALGVAITDLIGEKMATFEESSCSNL